MVLQQKVRVRVSVVPNIFMISLTFVRNSNGSHGTVGRTTRFWSGRYGFESQPSPTFLIITTENLATHSLLPPLIHELFRSWKSSETQHTRFPYELFGTARQKIFYRNSWFSPLRHKIFRYPKLSETEMGSCSKFFGTMRQKFSNGKSWYPLAEITENTVGIDVCKNSLKTNKTVVLFLTVCKSLSIYLGKKYGGASQPSCFGFFSGKSTASYFSPHM